MAACHRSGPSLAGVEDGSTATSPAFGPRPPRFPVAGHLSKAAWPPWASTAADGRSHLRRRWPSATGKLPTLAAREQAETVYGPCFLRPLTPQHPDPPADVGPSLPPP